MIDPRTRRRMRFNGRALLRPEGVFLDGSRGRVEFQNDVVEAEESSYILLDSHAHGSAEHVTLTGSDLLAVRDSTYTTCMPGEEDWILSASQVKLDKEKDVGTARNALVMRKRD